MTSIKGISRPRRFLRRASRANTRAVKSITTFCGSAPGNDPKFLSAATAFGRCLASRGIRLVYGGASVGTMGALADATLAAGGEVIGVIPKVLVAREVAHASLTELHVVDSMHDRKAKMMELGDAFVAMPGGIGTLEELFEVWTWRYLGIHRKPLALLDVDGYFDGIVAFLDNAVTTGFLRSDVRSELLVAASPELLVDRLIETIDAR